MSYRTRGSLHLGLLHNDLLRFRLRMKERDNPYSWAFFICPSAKGKAVGVGRSSYGKGVMEDTTFARLFTLAELACFKLSSIGPPLCLPCRV